MKNMFTINTNEIMENINYYKQTNKKIVAVLKADAYGCGYRGVTKSIDDSVDSYAVSSNAEAVSLSKITKKDILIMSTNNNTRIKNTDNIHFAVDNILCIDNLLKNYKDKIKVQIKIDTGMNRYGVKSYNELTDIILYCKNNDVTITGIFSHIYNAKNKKNTIRQMKIFESFISVAKYHIDYDFSTHILSSSSAVYYDKYSFCDTIRIGIGLYTGYKNAITLQSYVSNLRILNKGEYLGYGNYKVYKNCIIAILPIGYADGLDIRMSDRCRVKINDNYYKILGSVCMDCIFVKVDKDVKIGDVVTIIDDDINIEKLSKLLKTPPHKCLTDIKTKRIRRKYLK